MGTTTSSDNTYAGPYQTTADVNAILQGMTDASIDRGTAALPPQLQPGYQAPLPAPLQTAQAGPAVTLAPQLPPQLGGTVVPNGILPTMQVSPQQGAPQPAQQPDQRNYTVGPVRPGDPGYQPRLPGQSQPGQNQPGQVTPPNVDPWMWVRPVGPQPDPNMVVQPPQQPVQQPRTGERPPLNSMPRLWNGEQRGPSGQTKQQFLTGRMMHESQGDPTILNYVARNDPRMYNRGYTAGGLLQDLNSTWANGVKWASADPDRYPMSQDPRKYQRAMDAPWDVQWQVNSAIYDHAGETPWKERDGSFRGAPGLGEMRNQLDERTNYQGLTPAPPRHFGEWGRPPAGFGSNQPGAMPRQSDFGRIMTSLAPLLVGIGSLALRLPLSTAITAYGAMAKAQQNGQNIEYQRNRTHFQDQLKEATAQQTLESQDASNAFAEYGNNNPEGLQQELARVALKYNDPTMYRMAERGDLNGIHQLQQRRDMLNQNLVKTNKAVQDEQDQQAQNAAVAAMDRKWRQENPNATEDEATIAHNEHIGQAGRAGTTKDTSEQQEAGVRDVVGADGKPTGQQVREGKNGGYFDADTRQPVHLQKGETTVPQSRSAAGQGASEGMALYDVVGADGKPTGRQVRLGKNGGLYDLGTPPQAAALNEGEHLQPAGKGTGAGATTEGMTPYDVIGADGRPTGQQVRMGKNGGLYDLGTPPNPVTLAEGQTVRPMSRQAQPQPAANVPEQWDGAPYKPPPGVDAGLWQQAMNWAEQGKPPTGLGGRTSSMYQAVEPLVPAAMKAAGIQSLAEQQLKYEAKRHALNSIEQGFGSGVNGRNLISLNTVADHISLFRQYADALKNGDVQRINQLKNRLATEAGSPEVIDFALAGRITGDEVVRLLTTTGGTLADREDIASRLASYNSPDQFEGAAGVLTNYVRGRYGPLRQAYARGDPERERYFDNNMVTPEARHLFQGQPAPIPGQDEPQQPQTPTPAPTQNATPQRPAGLAPGSQWSPSRKQWRDPAGKLYNEDGSPAGG